MTDKTKPVHHSRKEPNSLNKKTGVISQDQAEEIVKKKRGAKWVQELTADGGGTAEPGDNARFIRYAMASLHLPPIDISDPKQVQDRLDQYFQFCADNDRRPQVVGMCNWLGISRDTINKWDNGVVRKNTHTDIIKKAYGVIEEMWIDFMQNGKINPATGIFLAKNYWHYKDVADVVVTPNNPLADLDDEQAQQRITDSIPIDTDSEVE